jgi:hypothetical protein
MNKNKVLLLSIMMSLFLNTVVVNAVPIELSWGTVIPTTRSTQIYGGAIASNGDIIVVGHRTSGSQIDGYVLRVTSEGEIVWEETYGGDDADRLKQVVSCDDGSFIAVGYTDSSGLGEDDGWIIKIDSDGNLLWEVTSGGSGSDGLYDAVLLEWICYRGRSSNLE